MYWYSPRSNKFDMIHKIVNQKESMRGFHYHNHYEIYYIMSGSHRYVTDNGIYELYEGDIIFLNTNVLHHTQGITDSREVYLIYCDKSIIENCGEGSEAFFELFSSGVVQFSFRDKEKEYIDMMFSKMYDAFSHPDKFSDQLLGNFFYELLTLAYKQNIINNEKNLRKSSDKNVSEDIFAALDFIYNNYKTSISLDDVAKHVNMSSSYFSKLFKKVMGIGFAQYLLSLRMKEACTLLETTSLPITEVALNSGFNSSQYFCNAFKTQKKISPFQYRSDSNSTENPQ